MASRKLIRTSTSNKVVASIRNWDKNRPPDRVRVKAIATDLVTRKAKWVDGLILVWKDSEGAMYCYDGIHRLEAARSLSDDIQLLIQLREDCPESVVMEEFLRINKSVPVSRLYSKAEQELTLKKTIETVVKNLQEAYPSFFKPSAYPRIPHANRDTCIEALYAITERHSEAASWTPEKWMQNCMLVSEQHKKECLGYALRKHKLTQKQKAKCEEHDFWLFAKRNWHDSI